MNAVEQPHYRWSPNVESVEMDGEWIILHAENHTITKLNNMGGWIWSKIGEGVSNQTLLKLIEDEYDVSPEQARKDLTSFLSDLIDAGIVESSL